MTLNIKFYLQLLIQLIFWVWIIGFGKMTIAQPNQTDISQKDAEIRDQTEPSGGGSRIQMEQHDLTYDFGVIPQMGKGEMIIKFSNTGREPLEVQKIEKGCGCTVTLLSDHTIPPGGKGEIKTIFKAGRRAGAVQNWIKLKTNDPAHKTVKLILKAFVEVDLDVKNSIINFGSFQKNEQPTVKYNELIGKELSTIKITKIESDTALVEVRLMPAPEQQQSPQIAVELQDNLPIGRLSATISISTDYPQKPMIYFRVVASVRGYISVQPQNLYFHIIPKNPHPKRTLTITHHHKQDFQILNAEIVTDPSQPDQQTSKNFSNIVFVEPTQDDLAIDIQPAQENGKIIIHFTFQRKLEAGERVIGSLKLTTNEPEEKELIVPYRAFTVTSY